MSRAVELAIFASRLDGVCDEMGVVLRRAALSPNIRDRLDFSCAIFDAAGGLCAQAAHIPVHLGSMAFAMADIVAAVSWSEGDMLVLNDPFLGGTHLPDVTLIAPLFVAGVLTAFVANRAHHADIGGVTPGSMPLSSRLDDEGLVIGPRLLVRGGEVDDACRAAILPGLRNPDLSWADFLAQISANRVGLARLGAVAGARGPAALLAASLELNAYGERLARAALGAIPAGSYRYTDWMDDDGQGHHDIPICVEIRVAGGEVAVDFTGTARQVPGNINCPLSVTAAAVLYALRCLMPPQTPACAGSFRPILIQAPRASLVHAERPAAVAAGNVETSSRLVDVVLGALALALPDAIPAASHGSMNNLAMGGQWRGQPWDYYETIGGGMGAGAQGGGWSGTQTHMTNTLNTPVEVLEARYPLRVERYALRDGSGGAGRRPGGDGLVRELRLLAPAQATLLTERRRYKPWGLQGGSPGAPGSNRLNGRALPPKTSLCLAAADLLALETAGGGGWGAVSGSADERLT